MASEHIPEDPNDDPIFLKRQVSELRTMLTRIVRHARSTSAAANCCLVHRQVIGEARELLDEADNDRIARFMELEAMEENDNPPHIERAIASEGGEGG